VRILLELEMDSLTSPAPKPDFQAVGGTCRGRLISGSAPGRFRYRLVVDPAKDLTTDDEVTISVTDKSSSGVPPCKILLRRSTCKIRSAFLESGTTSPNLDPQTRAALGWHAWTHYSKLVVLKRFDRGLGDSDVLVIRPQVRTPRSGAASLKSSGPASVLDRSWGSCMLVKTGKYRDIRKEWDRCKAYLADRLHPFLARCEAFLPIRSPVARRGASSSGSSGQATLISSFLGGDLLHPEPLDEIIRGIPDVSRCKRPAVNHDRTARARNWLRPGGRCRWVS
jgi:hypothetical protein